ncbi:MAG TPA: DoxX family protein [Tepidisphaeraceae bacterium]|jgi:putative oxidoreductase
MATAIKSGSVPARAYGTLVCGASYLQSPVLLLLRFTWGWQLVESGYGHLTHVQKTVDAFEGWGVPLPHLSVYVSGATELVGGSLLMLGLATRLISVPLVFNFIVAIVAASRSDIAGAFHKQGVLAGWDQIVNDTAFPMLMLALVMLAFGPGKVSIDYLLGRIVWRTIPPHADQRPGGFPVNPAQ